MSIHDRDLEQSLLSELGVLERLIDYVGPTPLRHRMNELIVDARVTLLNFDQDDYERPKAREL